MLKAPPQMKHDPIKIPSPPTRHRPWSRTRTIVAVIGKLLLALVVFCSIIAGWLYWEILSDRRSPLPDPGGRQGTCALWFIGSSSMHKWTTLVPDMKPWIAHNRGVDGAGISYLVRRFAAQDRTTPAPSAIVLYSGENDIANGKSVAETFANVRRLLDIKSERYGALPVFVVSIKPSPTRWRFRPQQIELNAALRDLSVRRSDLHYVDIVPQMLVNGRPGPWYQADGVHLNHEGYRRWGRAVTDALNSQLPAATVKHCAG